MSFLTKYLSRKFLIGVVFGPLVLSYGYAHGWPPALLAWIAKLMGSAVVSQGIVDAVNANRGFKREDVAAPKA
jgi:hypothetical protein